MLPVSAVDVAVSPNGNLAFTAGTGATSTLSIFNGTTLAAINTPSQIGGLSAPQGVIADASNDFWVANNGAAVVSEFSSTGAAVSTNGYTTTGTIFISGEFDGAGNYFTGGATTTAGIYELNSSGTQIAVFTPPTTYNQYFACDPSGNLWYGGNKFVGEMIGVAAPKVTPIATATFNGKLATRP